MNLDVIMKFEFTVELLHDQLKPRRASYLSSFKKPKPVDNCDVTPQLSKIISALAMSCLLASYKPDVCEKLVRRIVLNETLIKVSKVN